jgi:hypothetical protein
LQWRRRGRNPDSYRHSYRYACRYTYRGAFGGGGESDGRPHYWRSTVPSAATDRYSRAASLDANRVGDATGGPHGDPSAAYRCTTTADVDAGPDTAANRDRDNSAVSFCPDRYAIHANANSLPRTFSRASSDFDAASGPGYEYTRAYGHARRDSANSDACASTNSCAHRATDNDRGWPDGHRDSGHADANSIANGPADVCTDYNPRTSANSRSNANHHLIANAGSSHCNAIAVADPDAHTKAPRSDPDARSRQPIRRDSPHD